VAVIETAGFMDMTTIPIYVAVQNAYSKNSIPLEVHAIANVKLASDPRIVMNAVERFLGRDRAEIQRVAKETLEGALRGTLARMTPEEVNEDRLKFAAEISDEVEEDLEKLGLQVDTLKIQSVSDEKEYLDSIGRVRIAEAIKRAEIAESNARNEANKEAANAKALGDVAQEQAQKAILQKQNELRRIRAELEAQAEAEEKKAVAAGEAARATAEQELQRIRSELEQIRLQADVVIPWEAKKSQQEYEARAQAAPAPSSSVVHSPRPRRLGGESSPVKPRTHTSALCGFACVLAHRIHNNLRHLLLRERRGVDDARILGDGQRSDGAG
jgi:flotillin